MKYLTTPPFVLCVVLTAHAQQSNPNKLPPCPKPDYSNKSDATKTAKWNRCFGKITIEFSQYSNGDVYEGEFNNGKLNGYGIHHTASGNIYSGMFKDGNWHGKGILISADGVRFSGQYKNGIRSGFGIEVKKDGYIEEGMWEGFNIVSNNTIDSEINKIATVKSINEIDTHIVSKNNIQEPFNLQIKPIFDWVGPFKQGLAVVRIGPPESARYGFINKLGNFVINPQLDYADNFQEGTSRFKDNKSNKWGYIDKKGKIIIAPQYDWAGSFKNEIADVRIGNSSGFINKKGNFIINPQFYHVCKFNEGFACVQNGNGKTAKHGIIDKQGKFLIQLQSEMYIGDFSGGLARFQNLNQENNKWGFINKNNEIIISPQFDLAWNFQNGLAAVRIGDDKTGKWGFIDTKGTIIINPLFDDVSVIGFNEGFAAVRIGDEHTGKWGYINKYGDFVIKPQFDKAEDFNEGVAAVRVGDDTNGKWGYINISGEFYINPQFDSGYSLSTFIWLDRSFSEGLAAICFGDLTSKKCGFIARNDKPLTPNPIINSNNQPKYSSIKPPTSKFSIYAAPSVPDADGTVIITIRTNTDTSSLKVNGFEEGGKTDGKYSIKRVARVNQTTDFNIVATDIFGNKAESNITVKRNISTFNNNQYPTLKPENIKRKSDRDAAAIIIGISDYKNLPKADFANDDARVFYDYAIRALSIKPDNIKLLVDGDASEVGIYKAFKTWLPSKVRSSTDVYVFYSGHGLPTSDGKGLYLLPQQTDRDLISKTAIQMQEVISDIQSTKPKSVTLFLDACYSGQSRTGETLIASARPISIRQESRIFPENFTVITASQNDQISSSNPDLKHGIFSYYLMRGMEGDADTDKDGKITLGEMQSYLVENVGRQAGMINRKQEPQLIGDANRVLVGK